jgi:hypothetical protein
MKEKDIAEKYLLSYNDVFADIINGAMFGGEDIVKSYELTDANTVTQFKDDRNVHREQVRDIAKLWKKNKVVFSFIGIENQTAPDKDMILRVISYDGATYKSQCGNKYVYPVFTIVIYWGKAAWKVPTSIKDRIDCPEELKAMVTDYKFRLIDMARLTDEEIERYKSDFSFIAGIMAKRSEYRPNKKEIRHPEEVFDLLDKVIGDERFRKIKGEIQAAKKEGRKVDMCEFLDELENRGLKKGLEQGLEQGLERGRLEGEELATFHIAKNLKDNKVELDVIVKVTGLSKEKVEAL